MNKTVYVLREDSTGNFLSTGLRSMVKNVSLADHFDSVEEATRALVLSRVKADLSVVETAISIEQKVIKSFSKMGIILLRGSHLDATHVGLRGNAYFYLCDEESGKDYCYNDTERVWELCDWSDIENPKSQANEFIRINFEW